MHETPEDLEALQELLDHGYDTAGPHLRSMRYMHIRARPDVSATHLPGEEFAVTVPGRAVFVDVREPEGAALRRTLLDVYVPRYGSGWEEFLDSVGVYARIEARRMFTLCVDPSTTNRRLAGFPGGR